MITFRIKQKLQEDIDNGGGDTDGTLTFCDGDTTSDVDDSCSPITKVL